MDFIRQLRTLSPVEESHYVKELIKELKQAKQLAQKCIVKAQHSQSASMTTEARDLLSREQSCL